MTAEIGILNKSAVVIAADSAVTIGNGRKVFNTANKIFQLTYNDAIGIMIYNNANWMNMPLELIIKIYREKLNKTFPDLGNYADDFISFLNSDMKKHIGNDTREEIINYELYELLDALTNSVTEIIDDYIKNKEIERPKTEEEEIQYFENHLLEFLEVITSNDKSEKSPPLENYKITKFKNTYKKVFDSVLPGFLSLQKISNTNKSKIENLIKLKLFQEITSKIDENDNFTGIVIAGYGLDEIYPSIIDIRLSYIIDDIIKVEIVKELKITEDLTAIVKPFAQREMVDTFFQGIDPQLNEKTNNLIIKLLNNLESNLLDKYDKKISKKFLNKEINDFFEKFIDDTHEIRKTVHIDPIINTIEVLRKEDLIEIAESLVGITTIKRKASLEIETVGGPVDIAVITKGEGFVWIKRKEFIDKNLNHIFFEKELKRIK